MKIKKTPIIPIRLIQENHDIDWDGVPNFRDCQPLNPLRQDNIFRKKTRSVGLRYKIIEGKNDYAVVIDRERDWRSVFDGSLKQCQQWITKQYKMTE